MSEKASHIPPVDANAAFNPDLRENQVEHPHNFDHMQDFSLADAAPDLLAASEKLQADKELEAYFASRPYQDAKGNVHNPEDHSFINPAKHFETQRRTAAIESNKPYAERSIDEVRDAMVDAEFAGDKTTMNDLKDILRDKLSGSKLSTLAKELAWTEYYGADETNKIVNEAVDAKLVKLHNSRLPKADRPARDNADGTRTGAREYGYRIRGKETTKLQNSVEAADNIRARVERMKQAELKKIQETEDSVAARQAEQAAGEPVEAVESGRKMDIQQVRYRPRRDGKVQLGYEVNDANQPIHLIPTSRMAEFSQNPEHTASFERKIILTDTEGNEYYIHGNNIHRLVRDGGTVRLAGTTEIKDGGVLSPVQIGESWTMPDGSQTGAIDCVEYASRLIDANEEVEGHTQNGVDPFDRADALIEAAESAARAPRPAPEPDDVKSRWTQLKNLPLAAFTAGQRRLGSGNEHYKRNRALAALGTLALGYVGYRLGLVVGDEHHHAHAATSASPDHLHAAGSHASGQEAAQSATRHATELTSPTATIAEHGNQAAEHAHNLVTVHSGGNPWEISKHYLQSHGVHNPSNAQIEAYDKLMAHTNPDVYHYFGESSRHIPVNTQLKMPHIPDHILHMLGEE